MKTSWSYLHLFCHSTLVSQTDDRQATSYDNAVLCNAIATFRVNKINAATILEARAGEEVWDRPPTILIRGRRMGVAHPLFSQWEGEWGSPTHYFHSGKENGVVHPLLSQEKGELGSPNHYFHTGKENGVAHPLFSQFVFYSIKQKRRDRVMNNWQWWKFAGWW